MEQGELSIKLTGFQRFQLVRVWHKQGNPGNKEDFIRKVCQQKGLIYVPPIKVERRI